METEIITRVAPSPTGNGLMHLGTLRQIYHNWLFARANGGKLIFRIDDTDLSRSKPHIIDKLYEAVDWLGLDFDDTFKQSQRFDIYREYAEILIDKGLATEDEGCIRLCGPDLDCVWVDEITGIQSSSKEINEYAKTQIIIKSDGSPTYNFCSCIDDMICDISNVLRGVDHISNTYKQVYIYHLFETKLPKYHHIGLICHPSGKKLSKRDSDDMEIYKYHPGAVLNYILRLGWSPKIDDKSNNIIKRDKALDLFINGGSLKSSNAKIDLNKLNFYDKKYRNSNK